MIGPCVFVASAASITGLMIGGTATARPQTPAIEVGWWTRQPAADAPAGGFEVAHAPDGVLSLAALRTPAPTAAMRFPVEAEVLGALAAIRVCMVTSGWDPDTGGPLTRAPSYDCASGSSVAASRDGDDWAVTLPPNLASALADRGLAVVPDTSVPAVPFSVDFKEPQPGVAAAGPTRHPRSRGGSASAGATPRPDSLQGPWRVPVPGLTSRLAPTEAAEGRAAVPRPSPAELSGEEDVPRVPQAIAPSSAGPPGPVLALITMVLAAAGGAARAVAIRFDLLDRHRPAVPLPHPLGEPT